MMMNIAAIAIGEGGVRPIPQLVTGCGRKDKEMMTDDDDEQPRRWASDDDDDLI